MTFKELVDQNQTLHIHTAISAIELQHSTRQIYEELMKRLVERLVYELAPIVREEIERNLDFARIRKGVEDAIIAKAVESFHGGK